MSSEEKLIPSKVITNVEPSPWWKKLSWMVIIWLSSVVALFAVSSLFRGLMTAAGMKIK
ncbi:DUF2474 domain-containing protein [Moellerella wisconsensis]|uniref:DUF2474 domain-containing protein n=2 Tax=Moellerella wisconsensis TaxID=158849 RepID=A0ACD3YAY0_9GAMM|nr:DUF2474 domain-containing protein [Moellerella wisconsensis]UNH25430.1 DUF2474 domain-containing protein [Moellerella wisconsensis]UNH28615.1 DUF2474 domain-containing protein [Moellerella wisconsensis]UNH32068.1 DUF2474 domain-containing protein [Moellerella wisconsensis]UNH40223.1 DUF2474 domain-containing protein [Moellerella wisconsensis]UNH43759.1 DUF2474 domain-containing protein [Moellerella wisconsensis]